MVNNNDTDNNNTPILFNDFMAAGQLKENHLEYIHTDREINSKG
jgi:hypothetical protein